MPQIFQVLRCYQCSVFQLHQTKKTNKWVCKICGEKQSIKRHYGIGTAKDCRLHVQKLNSMQGDKNESIFNCIDSEESDSEDNRENAAINITNKADANNKSVREDSKWSHYIEKEDVLKDNVPMSLDNSELFLNVPARYKVNRKKKPFKVPNLSDKCNNKTVIPINDNQSKFNQNFEFTDLINSSNVNNLVESGKEKHDPSQVAKVKDVNNTILQTQKIDKHSKWTQFVDPYESVYNDKDNRECNIQHEQGDITYITDSSDDRCYGKNLEKSNYHYKSMENTSTKPIFSLCDDNDLDTILNF